MRSIYGAACFLWVWATAFGFLTQFYLKQALEKLG